MKLHDTFCDFYQQWKTVPNTKNIGRPPRRLLFVVSIIVLVIAGTGLLFRQRHKPAPPAGTETLSDGILLERVVQTVPRPLVWSVMRVDLQTSGLRFLVTPLDRQTGRPLGARTTSDFLAEVGAQVAVNGDFFYPFRARNRWDYYPHKGDPVNVEGRACSQGKWYPGSEERTRFPALFLTQENRAFIGLKPPKNFTPYNVVSGNLLFLEHGKLTVPPGGELQPRTAAGLSADGRFLWLLVADGRQKRYSEGATEEETAQFLQKRGAATVLNLDGGGSATLVMQRSNRIEVLNRPIHVGIPGRERPVANHLAIFTR